MGDPRGFIKIRRGEGGAREQASRCMDCGTPFCHWGCPIGNYIPEWNDLVFNDQWERAFELLDATNNMPEITGRICPAHCEFACVLEINDDPVTIRENELAVIERAFKKGWVVPRPPSRRTGFEVAVVGSGPAGPSAAAQLNKMGHSVTVFEQDDSVGGILRYGIPDFKLEKWILDRRIEIWKKEGIKFKTSVKADSRLVSEFDAVCLAIGCRTPRDLKIPGRELEGIHFAMDYLVQANKKTGPINAKGKKVVVIGGGDTGADCVGTANRQGAKCVVQIELLSQPPECRDESCPWPKYPLLLKAASCREDEAERRWSILTRRFKGQDAKVKSLECVKVKFEGSKMIEVPGTEFEIEADLIILAIGFVKQEIGTEWQDKKVFPAGDVARGPSLVVWAIYEGREAARRISAALTRA